MTIDRAVALLLDLAEVNVNSIGLHEAHVTLADFKERAFNLLCTWPGKSAQPPVEPAPIPTPNSKSEVTSAKVQPKKTWEATIDIVKGSDARTSEEETAHMAAVIARAESFKGKVRK